MTASSEAPQPVQQASAVPFRRRGDRIEFCLITSLTRKRWIFPKGVIDPGETPEQTALKEAVEEAGLHGRVIGPPLGRYLYHKWGRTLEVTVLLMEVDRSDERWQECARRQRRWASPAEAAEMLDQAELVEFAAQAAQRIESLSPKHR